MLAITSLQVPKDNSANLPDGGASNHCEDACSPPPDRPIRYTELPADGIRLAVSDGVSNTSFSGIWAALLVRAYVTGGIEEQLSTYRLEWWDRVTTGWPNLAGTPLKKARTGAAATMLGLSLTPTVGESLAAWRADACGDSCLVLVRKGQAILKFPLEQASQFNRMPPSIRTGEFKKDAANPATENEPAPLVGCTTGSVEPGDIFLLMTDALAKWFYTEQEEGGQPWAELGALTGPGEFEQWATENRTAGKIENDDVTLVLAEFVKEAPHERVL